MGMLDRRADPLDLLVDEVTTTVADPQDVEDEIRYLLQAVSM